MNVENGTVQMSPEESGTIFAVEDESCSDGDMDNEEYAYDQEEFDVDFQGQGDHETLPSIKFSADSLTNSEVEQDMDDLIEKVRVVALLIRKKRVFLTYVRCHAGEAVCPTGSKLGHCETCLGSERVGFRKVNHNFVQRREWCGRILF